MPGLRRFPARGVPQYIRAEIIRGEVRPGRFAYVVTIGSVR
jgi:hypothetical protein